MNPTLSRILVMATLLTLFNGTASAAEGLLDIEVSSNHLIEEEQPTTEVGDSPQMAVEHGDILEIEDGNRPSSLPMELERALVDIKLPSRGMNKEMVRQEFGEPLNMRPAVGKPPISSWVYADYTVYFEYEWVLHSVLNKK